MPQRKCAAKRLRVDKKRVFHNLKLKANLKKGIKELRHLVQQGKIEEAKEKLKIVFSKLDKAASKGLIHKNTASHRKSNLALSLNKKA